MDHRQPMDFIFLFKEAIWLLFHRNLPPNLLLLITYSLYIARETYHHHVTPHTACSKCAEIYIYINVGFIYVIIATDKS